VLVNGGLNLSELDGWWAEAYCPEVGWAIGDGLEHGDDPAWDATEADALYRVLERQVVPAFYTRDRNGIPTAWVTKMRESMARLTPQFSTNRSVREYTELHYLPAAAAYQQRAAGRGRVGAEIVRWRDELMARWSTAHFGELRVDTRNGRHRVEAPVYLGEIDPNAVRVELYAAAVDAAPPTREPMTRGKRLTGAANAYLYSAEVPAQRPAEHYTPRLLPYHANAVVPIESALILWAR
jgi:glycogen phosphorylase